MIAQSKHIVLSRFWVNDVVYHVADGSRGLVLSVQFNTERLVPTYRVVFPDRKAEWCDEMELSDERTFGDPGNQTSATA